MKTQLNPEPIKTISVFLEQPVFSKEQRKIAIAYVVLQVVVWVKSAWFFSLFGHGKSMHFSLRAFPESALLFDFFFHNAVHALIALLALLFGATLQRTDWLKLAAIVFTAVALHNLAYWLTATHPSLWYNVFDFARDGLLLLAFILAGYALKQLWKMSGKQQASLSLNS